MEWIVLLILVAAAVDWLSTGDSRLTSRAYVTRARTELAAPQSATLPDRTPCEKTAPARKDLRRAVVSEECTEEKEGEDKREDLHHTDEPAAPKNPLVSTTQLGRVVGIKAKPILFDALMELGYLDRIKGQYSLTDLGLSAGGAYEIAASGGKYVVWPRHLGASLSNIKQHLLDRVPFRLFHMTHLDNLGGIFAEGLHAHNFAPQYQDISNPDVNARRAREDPIHNLSLHEYVPLYFNPRNAMLYRKQREYDDNIVILEVSRSVCLQAYTLFTERNAASSRTRFEYCPSCLAEFDWTRINGRTWVHDGVTHVDEKQLMMSECLVHAHVDADRIEAVHTMNKRSASAAGAVQKKKKGKSTPVQVSSDLFF